jgi:hypothetical protein
VTPSVTQTPTPTPSNSGAPTPQVNIILNGRVDPTSVSFTNPFIFQYSLDGGSNWSDVGAQFDDTTCQQRATITVNQGASLTVRVKDTVTTGIFSSNRQNGGTCPSYTPGQDACSFAMLTNLNRTVSFNVNPDNQLAC